MPATRSSARTPAGRVGSVARAVRCSHETTPSAGCRDTSAEGQRDQDGNAAGPLTDRTSRVMVAEERPMDEYASVRYVVDDVQAAIDFYTEHLGFTVLSHPAPLVRRRGSWPPAGAALRASPSSGRAGDPAGRGAAGT